MPWPTDYGSVSLHFCLSVVLFLSSEPTTTVSVYCCLSLAS